MTSTRYDAVIVGGGPAGLSAALTLGRSRKRVLLCDLGPRRNAAAVHIHTFATRDGIRPEEFRRVGREQLTPYPSVEVRDVHVDAITGEKGDFAVRIGSEVVRARRVLLCTGLVDEVPAIKGFREVWGTSAFQCPYCHGWEVQDRRFGYLATHVDFVSFGIFLLGWARDVVVFTNGALQVPEEMKNKLQAAGVKLEERPIAQLVSRDGQLERVAFSSGAAVERDVMFVHPKQHQVDVVRSLELSLNEAGFVKVDEFRRETSRPGIYAGGDLTTQMQGAVLAAAHGNVAAAMLNHDVTMEFVSS